jgi:hypothetical protein
VITGFNTDVVFGGVTYHIQTEDKGLDTPIILSLVYDRGTILAAKREPYDDLLEQGFDETVLTERLRKQHKTICAAIKKGRIEELKTLGQNRKSKHDQAVIVPDIIGSGSEDIPDTIPQISIPVILRSEFDIPTSGPFDEVAVPIPMPKAPVPISKSATRGGTTEPVIENVTVIELPEPLPFDAVRVVSDLAGQDRPENSKLSLEFIGDDVFRGGTKSYVTVMVCRGSGRRVVDGAEVMVKLLGSSFRPLIFHSHTDKNGISTVAMNIPNFNTGRASILVRAINHGEEVEVRRPIIHG